MRLPGEAGGQGDGREEAGATDNTIEFNCSRRKKKKKRMGAESIRLIIILKR